MPETEANGGKGWRLWIREEGGINLLLLELNDCLLGWAYAMKEGVELGLIIIII